MTLPIDVPQNFCIIAHRGASAYAPENTMAAFQMALEMDRPHVELDTQLTVDGQIALCHDQTLVRYGHGEQVVEEMRWSDLAALDMGAWFSPFHYGGERMITLDQLFEHFGERLFYHVELKGRAPQLPAAVHACITQHDLHERCIVTSFSYDSLAAMREIDSEIRLGWLVRTIDDDVMDRARALRLFQLCPFAGSITRAVAERARSVAPEVRAWGLLGETATRQSAEVHALIHNVLQAGCDGMTINWPDWVAHR